MVALSDLAWFLLGIFVSGIFLLSGVSGVAVFCKGCCKLWYKALKQKSSRNRFPQRPKPPLRQSGLNRSYDVVDDSNDDIELTTVMTSDSDATPRDDDEDLSQSSQSPNALRLAKLEAMGVPLIGLGWRRKKILVDVWNGALCEVFCFRPQRGASVASLPFWTPMDKREFMNALDKLSSPEYLPETFHVLLNLRTSRGSLVSLEMLAVPHVFGLWHGGGHKQQLFLVDSEARLVLAKEMSADSPEGALPIYAPSDLAKDKSWEADSRTYVSDESSLSTYNTESELTPLGTMICTVLENEHGTKIVCSGHGDELKAGAHAFARYMSEGFIRVDRISGEFGGVACFSSIFTQSPGKRLLAAGEIEVDANSMLLRWNNICETYRPARDTTGQAGLPIEKLWLYMSDHEWQELPRTEQAVLLHDHRIFPLRLWKKTVGESGCCLVRVQPTGDECNVGGWEYCEARESVRKYVSLQASVQRLHSRCKRDRARLQAIGNVEVWRRATGTRLEVCMAETEIWDALLLRIHELEEVLGRRSIELLAARVAMYRAGPKCDPRLFSDAPPHSINPGLLPKNPQFRPLGPDVLHSIGPSAESEPPRLPLVGLRALIVDDEEAGRTMVANALAALGAECIQAADGEEAIEMHEGGMRFDIITMDEVSRTSLWE